jgi:Domain of unknown function (DUF4262)
MCWMCDHPGSTAADYLNEVYGKMQRNGLAIQYVEDDRGPFAYTVGLTCHGLPELLVTGVSPRGALDLLNPAVESALSGEVSPPGARVALAGGAVVEIVEVEQPDAHLKGAFGIFGDEIKALQLVWADERGRWPWAPDFDDGRGTQPVLGARATRRSG